MRIKGMAVVMMAGMLAAVMPQGLRAEEVEEEVGVEYESRLKDGEWEEINKLLPEIKKHNTRMHGELMRQREKNPAKFEERARHMLPMLRDPAQRKEFFKHIEAEHKAQVLIKQYRQAKGDKEKKRLKGELRTALEGQFDAKLAKHEMHLKKMKEEIARLEQRVTKRRSLKNKIVEKRLNEISDDEESWEWR